jgi:hypothetical protein
MEKVEILRILAAHCCQRRNGGLRYMSGALQAASASALRPAALVVHKLKLDKAR